MSEGKQFRETLGNITNNLDIGDTTVSGNYVSIEQGYVKQYHNNVLVGSFITSADLTSASGVLEAPNDGTKYVRQDLAWVSADTISGSVNGEDGKTYKIVSGVIRNDTSGWHVIEDADHTNINISNIAQDAGSIAVGYADIDVKKVVSLLVVPDETLASTGFTFGASVTKGTAYIQAYRQQTYQGAYVEYNGTAFVNNIKGDASPGVGSMTWDSGVKALLLRHTTNEDLYEEDWQNNIPHFTPVVDWSNPSTNFSIKVVNHGSTNADGTFISFFDKDGVRIDTPTTDLKFYWSRTVDGRAVRINPDDINTVKYPLSNLWVYGIFEV